MNQMRSDAALFASPLLTLMGLVFEAASGGQAQIDRLLGDSPLDSQLFNPLIRLSRTEGGRLRMTDLAAQCRCSASALTRVADRLEGLGFASREASPDDRRVVFLAITAAGRQAVLDLLPDHIRNLDQVVFGGLDADERRTLDGLLHKVRDAVHPDAASVTPIG